MLYTGKGDNGTTKLFDCPQGTRVSKGSLVFEALGTLDEVTSNLGYVKVLVARLDSDLFIKATGISYGQLVERLQQNLFSIQAELGGSDIHLTQKHTEYLEKIIHDIDALIPPIRSFVLPGGQEASAYLDITRTLARRAERQVVIIQEKKERIISAETVTYLNRLSSILYALARFINYEHGYREEKPSYQ